MIHRVLWPHIPKLKATVSYYLKYIPQHVMRSSLGVDILSLKSGLIQVNRKDKTQYLGKINLIDLAGSENVNKSGVQGPGAQQ